MSANGSPVGKVVRATWRAVRLARLAESVLLGATALSIGLTAAVLSGERGAPVRSWGDAWLAAFVCAVCCALSWWVEHRPRPADVAARIDTKLRLSGALVTAFELEAVRVPGAASSGIGRLLLERVTRRVTRKDGLRVALPRSGKFLALPLIAAGLLAGALDMRREEPPPVPLDRLLAGLAGEAAALGAGTSTDFAAGDLTAEEVRAALDLAARAGRLELSAGAGPLDPQEREELAREAELLQGELQELSTRLPPDSETARAAERAASWAEVAGTGGRDPDRAPAAAPDVAPDEAPHETGQGESDGSGGLEVAAGPADGTMLGSPAELGDPFDGSGGAASPAPESAREERGVVAGRWWPARYDSVVERWVEVRRARLRSESR